jgi:hypothetical protein
MRSRTSKARRRQRERATTDPSRHGCRALVFVESAPLRKTAAAEARALMKETERLRGELEAFERVAVPEFERWKAVQFGTLLTGLRETEARLQQTGDILENLHARAFFEGISPEEAYLREKADEAEAQRREAGRVEDEEIDGEEFTDEEMMRPVVDAFIREVFGLDPREVPPNIYAEILRDFQGPPRGGSGAQEEAEQRGPRPAATSRRAGPESPLEARLKELYRQLARRLHPDAGGRGATIDLWHDFQEAHGRGDVERLEILVAVTDLREGIDAAGSTLFHLREAAREFRRGVRALRQRLSAARRSEAWKLWKGQDRTKLAHEMRKKLHREHFQLQEKAKFLEQELARIKRAAEELARRKGRQKPGKRARPRRPQRVETDDTFDFFSAPDW